MGGLQTVMRSEGLSENTPLPGNAVGEDPYEHTMYERLCEGDVEEYLKGFGMYDVTPVCFCDPAGTPRLELYYDRETGQGCGLKYEKTESGTDLLGFAIDGYRWDCYWNYPNPYATDMIYETAASAEVDKLPDLLKKVASKFKDTFERDREGRLLAWRLKGNVETEAGEGRWEELLTVSFSYREDGTLREKRYQFNGEVVPYRELGGNQRYVYDERERLLYAEFETVMGDCYFVYEGDCMVPCAWLEVWSNYAGFTRVKDREYDNWLEIPREGAEAFLRQIGLDSEDKLYEFRQYNDGEFLTETYRESVLTLYYNPERELGCGYECYPEMTIMDRARPDMAGFQFKGCIKIDCREYDPYEVFADYHDTGDLQDTDTPEEIKIHCIPLEELSDTYSYENAYVCEYREGRLARIQMDRCCGSVERFYIYDGESEVPSYCLNFFYGCRPGVTLFEFF